MTRNNLRMVPVYATEAQQAILKRAAAAEHRSLSNYLLRLGLERAEALGITDDETKTVPIR
jgi:uncharacterized protein (DUF1778 family)